MLRTLGQWMAKIRRMASEFQGQFQEAMREAEMADLKKQVDEMAREATSYADFDPIGDVRKRHREAIGTGDRDARSRRRRTRRDAAVPIRRAGAAPATATPSDAATDRSRSARRRSRRVAVDAPVPMPERRRRRAETAPVDAATPRRAKPRRRRRQGRMSREDDEKEIEATKAPLMEHLIELRSRLIKALVAFVAHVHRLLLLRQAHLQRADLAVRLGRGRRRTPSSSTPRCSNISVTQLKLAMFGAAFIVVPGGRGADLHVRRARPLPARAQAFLPYLVATPIFFVLGALVVYFLVMPMLVRFSLGMQQLGGAGPGDDRAAAQGRRISRPDDVAGARLRRRVPAAGDPDAARPRRHHHLASSSRRSGAISSSAPS